MKVYIIKIFTFLLVPCTFLSCKNIPRRLDSSGNLVISNQWFIAGPSLENEMAINTVRKTENLIKVTVNNAPVGEIELNVMITASGSNDGPPTDLPANSSLVEFTYKSSHLIKFQAREGTPDGTGCEHGGSHPTVDLPASPGQFITINIPWTDFKRGGSASNKLLNINNLCKFNFVYYHPIPGAILEIASLKIK